MSVELLLGSDRQTSVWQRYLPQLLSLLFLAFALWTAAALLWRYLDPPETETAAAPMSSAIAAADRIDRSVQLASLAQVNIFGLGDASSFGLPNAPNAPETQLKLVLIGVAAGKDPKTGVAIIADENNRQRQYQSGQVVGGAVLDSIYRDRVVLLYQGRLETLKLPRLVDANTMASGEPKALDAVNPAAATDVTGQMIPALANNEPGSVSPQVSTASFAAVREQVLANPMELASKIQPVIDSNGNLSGIKLSMSDPLLTSAGLRPDDVIVAVNGQRIDSFQKGQMIAESLASANEISVIVRREGREITLPAVRFR